LCLRCHGRASPDPRTSGSTRRRRLRTRGRTQAKATAGSRRDPSVGVRIFSS
jgi:hypothetical protein